MLFLPVILFLNIFAASNIEEVKVEKMIRKYINQAASGEVNPSLYTKSFNDFIDGDKEVFAVCKKRNCKISLTLTKVDPKRILWLARLKVQYKEKKELKTISHKQGCYYVQNMQMYAYVEDCDTR